MDAASRGAAGVSGTFYVSHDVIEREKVRNGVPERTVRRKGLLFGRPGHRDSWPSCTFGLEPWAAARLTTSGRPVTPSFYFIWADSHLPEFSPPPAAPPIPQDLSAPDHSLPPPRQAALHIRLRPSPDLPSLPSFFPRFFTFPGTSPKLLHHQPPTSSASFATIVAHQSIFTTAPTGLKNNTRQKHHHNAPPIQEGRRRGPQASRRRRPRRSCSACCSRPNPSQAH